MANQVTTVKRQSAHSTNQINESFYKEAMEKERNFILEQLRDNSSLFKGSPLARIMHLNNRSSVAAHLKRPNSADFTKSSLRSSSNMNYVDDQGGQFLLTRGTLPSSIPGIYNTVNSSVNWDMLKAKYKELQRELEAVNSKIEAKQKEVSRKLKHADSSLRELSASRIGNVRELPSKVGSAIHGSGFKWKGTQKRDASLFGMGRVDSELAKELTEVLAKATKSTDVWGELTRGCDQPQQSLYLRSEPFVPKTKRSGTSSTSNPFSTSSTNSPH